MDVKEVGVTHYDWMKMTGELPMTTRSEPLKTYLGKDMISWFNEDKWKQFPTRIMLLEPPTYLHHEVGDIKESLICIET